MKKILVLSNGSGGLFGFRRELMEELCAKYEVIALAKPTGNVNALEKMGCRLIPVDMEYHGTNPIKELKLVSYYKKMLRELQPDVVLTYTIKPNIYGGMACAALGIPYIENITGLGTAVENGGLLQKITVPMYGRGLRKARLVFFQNRENLEFMQKRRMLSGPFDLLPGSGVNLDRFPLLEYPKEETVHFTFISRIMQEKGIDQYIDAARAITKKYPNTCFHVYGSCEGGYKERLEALEREGVLQYHGYTKDVLGVHRNSSCTVHPSFYPEGMSNVLLESAACGRPVITTDRPGCKETLDDGVTGFVVKQRSSEDLIEKIEKFLSLSWEARREMGLAGRAKMEREFDRNVVVKKYLNLIEEITQTK